MPASAATQAAVSTATNAATQAAVTAALAPTPPASAFASAAAHYFAVPARRSFDYALLLVKDIPADKFAHMPHPTMNHPAFNLGHLSLYPNRIFTMLDRKDLVQDNPRHNELFAASAKCVEQDGRYPDKAEIVEAFTTSYTKLLNLLPTVTDAMLAKPNPIEGRMREIFPTVGIGVNFMLNNHTMMHLGQISAWRRAVGLPSVM